MSKDTAIGSPQRVLVLDRSATVIETVVGELVDYGIDARGTSDIASAVAGFDAARFDLVAFVGGLDGMADDAVRRAFAERNPAVRFLEAPAPLAVRQIIDAIEGAGDQRAVDLDAYFARIGHDGPRDATIETLRTLHALHPAAIAFEAIDVLLDRGVDIAPAAVDAKLIGARRGGYCYEQNSLFKRVLVSLGFDVSGLAARVRWMAPPGTPARPRTHMALKVVIDGTPWLADVGFGGLVPTAPLRMDTVEPQPTGHETFRVVPFGDGFLVQALIGERWSALYDLSPEPLIDVDYELPNWFTSAHPTSHFRKTLIVARTTPEARYALRNGRFSIRTPDGEFERRSLDVPGLEQVLAEVFGLPVEPDWRPVLESAAALPDG